MVLSTKKGLGFKIMAACPQYTAADGDSKQKMPLVTAVNRKANGPNALSYCRLPARAGRSPSVSVC